MAAADTDALRAELEAARRELAAEQARGRDLDDEIEEAEERRRLRQELERVRFALDQERKENRDCHQFRQALDTGGGWNDHLLNPRRFEKTNNKRKFIQDSRSKGSKHCSQQVARGEYVWTITGMSWLRDALWTDGTLWARSEAFSVGFSQFSMVYNPDAGRLTNGPDAYLLKQTQ